MDMETCDDDSFYGNFDRIMPSSDNYTFDDIEEILRSTDSHLDSSIDLNNLNAHNVNDFELPFDVDLHSSSSQVAPSNDEFNFALPLSANELQRSETCNSTYKSQRTSSISSMDEDSFNPDDFINFLKNDDVKMNFLNDNELRQRNTPSPTESCSSSGGSSTSGVQSDVSSIASQTKAYMQVNPPMDILKCMKEEISNENTHTPAFKIKEESCFTPITMVSPSIDHQQTIVLPAVNTTVGVSLPLMVPVVPLNTNANNTPTLQTIQPLQQVQPISVLSGTLLPIKTVPIKPITQITSHNKHTSQPKIEPKLAPKGSADNTNNTVKTPPTTSSIATKVVPPINAKPKTVFLTLNDYKALTQVNGKNVKGVVTNSPKIILKTASGKVITANKIVSSGNSTLGMHSNFVPKIVKTNNGPVFIKQPSSKIPHTAANTIGTQKSSAVNNGPTSLGVYKGLIDEKMWKKQQRMIKNRESASLSRKKKKEYVVALESRISDLEKENCTLKGDNSSLRSQLVALAQSCQCKNSNISEFVLNTLDINAKVSASDQHVKIAPKLTGKSLKQRMTATNVKKNIAILFALAFMVSLNVGNFQNYMNKNHIENSIESAPSAEEPATGRRLLWAETETEFKQKLNNTKREAEMDVPPLHFLHPVNRSRRAMSSEPHANETTKEIPLTTAAKKCPNGSNYTENHRLHSNLHKWIDVNDYLNLSLYKDNGNGNLDNSLSLRKFSSDYYDRKPLQLPLQEDVPTINMKRKLIMTPPLGLQGKQPKLETPQANEIDDTSGNEKNSLDIFKPKISEEYLRLFKGIKRQDDTFYVLSFNMDHILLPASAYNKSARPKMSLMLPAGDPSVNGDIMLMQIDCEVVNTTELELKSFMIPEKLRPQKFGNGNYNPPPNPNDMVNNETRSREEERKAKGTMPEMPKQKSAPKTYYMMGPRSAAAAAAMKKKPTLVRLGSNDSIESLVEKVDTNATIFSTRHQH
ncbi:cyclic AMP-dependent transcription factor ATF-6 alpha [Zeugodacus cucurbitae]|uniref:Cyclic AMP-dependent transcription factor ATF-6 alpha n=1 Tax=Zeugodacus cucurbitae TaxID=28588 RepID=A0A0A1WRG8_ZEUCU|nr:cyclic AMP-dependent transcription factor ATF-6 alpha [Zeugodacus cucurbitae]